MSLIIIDDKYYKAAIQSLKSKLNTDKKFNYQDFPAAIDNIPSSADGTDNPIMGIYFVNPDDEGYPTKAKIVDWTISFPISFTQTKLLRINSIEFINCTFGTFNDKCFEGCVNLKHIILPSGLISFGFFSFRYCYSIEEINLPSILIKLGYYTFSNCTSLKKINIPSSLVDTGTVPFDNCTGLTDVTLGDGFNANNLNLSSSTRYTREIILQWLNALADRTGETAYKLTIGKTNLAKLTEEDIAIATAKNWTLL